MPRQYFFWKYFNTIIVLYCILVQKSPIFVQLSPIQCTYSNIFIRFFKYFPANTNIYQNSYRVIGALCGLRQGVLSSQCGHLISFGTKYFVIASENTGTPRDTLYPWGKGINKQKTSFFAFSVKWLVKSAVYDAQRTLCHSEELHSNDVRIPRKGTIL